MLTLNPNMSLLALVFQKKNFGPKWCVLAGSSDIHLVCVCTYHQNMKWLLAPLNITCQELFPLIVYDNKEQGMYGT